MPPTSLLEISDPQRDWPYLEGDLDTDEYRLDRLRGGLLDSEGDLRRRTGGDLDFDDERLLVRLLSRPLRPPFVLTGGLLDRDGDLRLRTGGERERDRDAEVLYRLLRGDGDPDLDLDLDLDSLLVGLLPRPLRPPFSIFLRGGLGLLDADADLLE